MCTYRHTKNHSLAPYYLFLLDLIAWLIPFGFSPSFPIHIYYSYACIQLASLQRNNWQASEVASTNYKHLTLHTLYTAQTRTLHSRIHRDSMSSCRGILIAGVTNQARTQMAEGFLRAFTRNAIFVCSGALRHAGRVHPLAQRAMAAVNLSLDGQSSTSLEGARRQRSTYDVYISIDEPYVNRRSDRYQQLPPAPFGCGLGSMAQNSGTTANNSDRNTPISAATGVRSSGSSTPSLTVSTSSSMAAYGDPLLASGMPAHWKVAQDTTDSRQSWTLWSPRDPAIFHENSTRKLQDHLYEGEPLFMRVQPSDVRRACRVQRRWELPALTEPFAMETEAEQFGRFVAARDSLAPLCVELIQDLEREYGEALLDGAAVAAYTSALSSSAAAAATKMDSGSIKRP